MEKLASLLFDARSPSFEAPFTFRRGQGLAANHARVLFYVSSGHFHDTRVRCRIVNPARGRFIPAAKMLRALS